MRFLADTPNSLAGFSYGFIDSCVIILGGMVMAEVGAYSKIPGLAQLMECFGVVACGFLALQKVN